VRLGAAALERSREELGEERYYRGLMDVYGAAPAPSGGRDLT